MAFSPNRGSQDTLVSLSGNSLFSVSGVYLVSGSSRGQATLVSTSTNLITFYPPSTPPGNLRSGQWSVYNTFGNATENNYFTFINTPFISGIFPLSGSTGVGIKISGSGIRDISGLYFVLGRDEYTGVFNTPIFEANTWITTGYIPFISGSLGYHTQIRAMSEGGASTASQTFYIRENGLTLSGFSDFPTPFVPLNYLRENSLGTSLEWRTPTEVRSDINAISKTGDWATGDYTISGNVRVTGLVLHNTGLATGQTIFRTTIFSGNYLTMDAIVGGITWRCFSLKFS